MRRRDRLLFLAIVLVLIGGARLGQQLFRWYAFSEERGELARLEAVLEEAAVGIISTQLRSDTLRQTIEMIDQELADRRQVLDARERQLVSATDDGSAAMGFHSELTRFNERVGERNAILAAWRRTLLSNQRFVQRYNAVVDSIRSLALGIGEPYYPIPTPAEVAVRRGLVPEDREADP